jgi:hypothetical protein
VLQTQHSGTTLSSSEEAEAAPAGDDGDDSSDMMTFLSLAFYEMILWIFCFASLFSHQTFTFRGLENGVN